MAIIERDIVLMSKDENGNTTIDKPITRLANIEADADVKETLANGDFIPVIDSEDNEQIKMVSVNKIMSGNAYTGLESDTATVTVNGNTIQSDVKLADYERNLLKKASWTTGLVVDKDDIDTMLTASSAEGNIIEKKSDGFYATVSDEILNEKVTNYAKLDTVNEFNDGMILNKNVYIPNVGWFKMTFSYDGKITINTDDFGSENSYFQISANKGTTTFKQVVDNEFMELKFDQGVNEIASNANISAPNIKCNNMPTILTMSYNNSKLILATNSRYQIASIEIFVKEDLEASKTYRFTCEKQEWDRVPYKTFNNYFFISGNTSTFSISSGSPIVVNGGDFVSFTPRTNISKHSYVKVIIE